MRRGLERIIVYESGLNHNSYVLRKVRRFHVAVPETVAVKSETGLQQSGPPQSTLEFRRFLLAHENFRQMSLL